MVRAEGVRSRVQRDLDRAETRVKMGTFNEAEGEELRRMIEEEAEFFGLEKLFGLHGWSRAAAARPAPRPRDAQGREAAVIRHDWTRAPGGVSSRRGATYIHPADAAGARKEGAVWHAQIYVPYEAQLEMNRRADLSGGKTRRIRQRGLMYFPKGRPVPSGLRTIEVAPPRPSGRLRDLSPATAFQAYIERDGAVEIDAEGAPISLGWMPNLTVHLGEDGERLDRMAFWREAERIERRSDARIQGRIIAELPYEPEIGPEGRRRIVENFGTLFDALGLPWWAVVHTPEPGHDERNYHVHLLYSERPWSYTDTEGPYGFWTPSARKSEAVRDGGWMNRVRAQYVDAMNMAYERAGLDRRIAQESYRARGVDAVAQAHLGNAASAMERRGIATGAGAANGGEQARRAIAPRIRAHGKQRVGAYEARTSAARATIREALSELAGGARFDGYLVRAPNGAFEAPEESIRVASRLLRLTDRVMAEMIRAEVAAMTDQAMRARWPDRVDAVARTVEAARRAGRHPAAFPELDEAQVDRLGRLAVRLGARMRAEAQRRHVAPEKIPEVVELRDGVVAGTDAADDYARHAEAALRIARLRAAEAREEEAGSRYRIAWMGWHRMAPGIARASRMLIARDFVQAMQKLLRDEGLEKTARAEFTGAVRLLAGIARRGRGVSGVYPQYVRALMARLREGDKATPTHGRRKDGWDEIEKLAAAFVTSEASFESYTRSLRQRLKEGGRASLPAAIRRATHGALVARADLASAGTALAAAEREGRVRKRAEDGAERGARSTGGAERD